MKCFLYLSKEFKPKRSARYSGLQHLVSNNKEFFLFIYIFICFSRGHKGAETSARREQNQMFMTVFTVGRDINGLGFSFLFAQHFWNVPISLDLQLGSQRWAAARIILRFISRWHVETDIHVFWTVAGKTAQQESTLVVFLLWFILVLKEVLTPIDLTWFSVEKTY